MERHVTVLLDLKNLKIAKCSKSHLYCCPFCTYKTEHAVIVNYHINGHSSVKHKEFTIIKCGLSCRKGTHFHCCYCMATVLNRNQFLKHITQQHPVAIPQPSKGPQEHPVALQQSPQGPQELPVALQQSPQGPQEHPVALQQSPQGPQEHPVALQQSPQGPQEHLVEPQQHAVPSTEIHIPQKQRFKSTVPATKGMCRKLTINCPHCQINLNRKNFKTHLKRKHTDSFETVSKDRYFRDGPC
ncbi:hypothetical protein DPEC_G00019810 [Dallia pectoralis]|uniref:Uncharacterized protein n=1 Tax=Dallia pectoralis TaxID=75939 RepID=A0ACC2HFR3_DALPE|nr:hypothetical protein DPEC_G00019810 [Dallia pectoralis]